MFGEYRDTPPIYLRMLLQSVPFSYLEVACIPLICMPYTSDLYRNAFEDVSVSGVVGTLPKKPIRTLN